MNKKTKISVCAFDCPNTCSLSVDIDTNSGKIVSVKGNPVHPLTKGLICQKVKKSPERIYHSERILQPMLRIGSKGSGKFQAITWSQALDTIYQRFNEIITEYGAESILPYSYAGTMGIINNASMDRRFFHKLGASQLERTICSSAGSIGYSYTIGSNRGVDPELTANAKYIIVWGADLVSTNIHQLKYITEARKNGAKVVLIDVHKTETSSHVDQFIHIQPGTDGALALAMINYIIANKLYNESYVKAHTSGFDELCNSVKKYDVEWASQITGVNKEDITKLAYDYSAQARSFIFIGNGLQHHYNGGMAVRNIACLPGLTGAWQNKGCGAIKSNSDYFNINKLQLEMPELAHKKTRIINMNQLGAALNAEQNALIKALFVYNSNPAIVAPDQSQILKGLKREDLFTVVHEIFMTDTAKYADIILPAPTSFEYPDVYRSYWHGYLQLAEQVIELQGQALHNTELFRQLAAKFGFNDSCFLDTDEQLIIQAIDKMHPEMNGEQLYQYLLKTGSTKILETPKIWHTKFCNQEMENNNLPSTPSFTTIKDSCNSYDTSYPLTLINGPDKKILNSSFANIDSLNKNVVPTLLVNPTDAQQRNLTNGDLVQVINHLGTCKIKIKVTDNVSEKTVVSTGLWWNDAYASKTNLNQLVSQDLSDMGNGAVFFSTFVDIKKVYAD